jgi:catechol 2,3-dioxygenase-like lactoylglutathione lyase family enzyme
MINSGNCSNLETRRAFYRNIDGVILVHDTRNSKSHANLSRWALPFLDHVLGNRKISSSRPIEVQIGTLSDPVDFPVLVGELLSLIYRVGTRIDESMNHQFRSSVAEQYGGDQILLNATTPISPAVYAQFAQFFDSVYSKRSRNRN